MGKIKWHYSQKEEEYYTMYPDHEYQYDILKISKSAYKLTIHLGDGCTLFEHTFSRLKNAKEIARLVEFG